MVRLETLIDLSSLRNNFYILYLDIIRSSIDRGFAEAEKILGQLAEVSKETYELIQEKLDKWIEGEEDSKE